MYTEAQISRGGRSCTVRAVVTQTPDRERKLVTPVEVRTSVGWTRIPNDDPSIEEAEDALIDAFYPEAEAGGDWRLP